VEGPKIPQCAESTHPEPKTSTQSKGDVITEEIREGTVEEEIAILGGEMKCMKAELGEERATPLS
jgi:hypothetical protein